MFCLVFLCWFKFNFVLIATIAGFYLNEKFIVGYDSNGVTWLEAESLCQNFESHLVSIHNYQDVKDAYDSVTKLTEFDTSITTDETQWFFAWIGLKSLNKTRNDTLYYNISDIDWEWPSWSWFWMDGIENNISAWYDEDDDNNNNNNYDDLCSTSRPLKTEKCGHFVGKQVFSPALDNPVWDAGNCNYNVSGKQYICDGIDSDAVNKNIIRINGNSSASVCTHDGYIGVYSPNVSYTWSEAHKFCINHFGSGLGSLDNSQENIASRFAFGSCLPVGIFTNYWIGFTNIINSGSGTFEWADPINTTSQYSNWDSGICHVFGLPTQI